MKYLIWVGSACLLGIAGWIYRLRHAQDLKHEYETAEWRRKAWENREIQMKRW
jgi:hypothetical protein